MSCHAASIQFAQYVPPYTSFIRFVFNHQIKQFTSVIVLSFTLFISSLFSTTNLFQFIYLFIVLNDNFRLIFDELFITQSQEIQQRLEIKGLKYKTFFPHSNSKTSFSFDLHSFIFSDDNLLRTTSLHLLHRRSSLLNRSNSIHLLRRQANKVPSFDRSKDKHSTPSIKQNPVDLSAKKFN